MINMSSTEILTFVHLNFSDFSLNQSELWRIARLFFEDKDAELQEWLTAKIRNNEAVKAAMERRSA